MHCLPHAQYVTPGASPQQARVGEIGGFLIRIIKLLLLAVLIIVIA